MNIEEAILEKPRDLPTERKLEVPRFVASLGGQGQPPRLRQSIEGAWSGRGIHVTEEDLAVARREMWGGAGAPLGQARHSFRKE